MQSITVADLVAGGMDPSGALAELVGAGCATEPAHLSVWVSIRNGDDVACLDAILWSSAKELHVAIHGADGDGKTVAALVGVATPPVAAAAITYALEACTDLAGAPSVALSFGNALPLDRIAVFAVGHRVDEHLSPATRRQLLALRAVLSVPRAQAKAQTAIARWELQLLLDRLGLPATGHVTAAQLDELRAGGPEPMRHLAVALRRSYPSATFAGMLTYLTGDGEAGAQLAALTHSDAEMAKIATFDGAFQKAVVAAGGDAGQHRVLAAIAERYFSDPRAALAVLRNSDRAAADRVARSLPLYNLLVEQAVTTV